MTEENHTILTTHNLTIGYPRYRQSPVIIAENLSLSLQTGQLVCLLGRNGSGKSTLLRTLAGIQAPIEGEVRLLGENVHQTSVKSLAKRLSLVLTDKLDLDLISVYDLVALGRYPYTDWWGKLTVKDQEVINSAIAMAGIVDLKDRQIQQLSDGQRQKVMIARALAQEPLLMLLDEPTAYLDLPRRVEVMQLLRQLGQDCTRAILLSTHDLDLALRCADVIWLLGIEGNLTVGTPEDLVLNGVLPATFETEGVTFDLITGTFQFKQPQSSQININGDGIAKIWTTRALERKGFYVTDDDQNASIQVTIDNHSGEFIWRSHIEQINNQHHSLADLLSFLSTQI